MIATGLLWIIYLIVWRKYIYIFPAGLLGCAAIGIVNGIGSLFYYNGLYHLDASVAQVLNASYLMFVVLLSHLGGQRMNIGTLLRVFLVVIGVVLTILGIAGQISWLGVALMMGNAVLFAGTVVMSQRVLFEMPAPTMVLYVLTTMSIVVVIARLFDGSAWVTPQPAALWAIIALGGSTALARLTLFMGVKELGLLRTALLSVLELAMTLLIAVLFLHEQLTALQWIGVVIMMTSLFLIRYEPRRHLNEAASQV